VSVYTLTVLVQGKDAGAVSVLSGVQKSLRTLGMVTLGGLAAGLGAVSLAVGKLAAGAIESAAHLQMFTVALETLAAAELARGEVSYEAHYTATKGAQAEADKVKALELRYNTLGAQIKEQQQKVIQLTAKWGDQGLAVQTARARLAEMEQQQITLKHRMADLRSESKAVEVTWVATYKGGMDLADAMIQAKGKAQELLIGLRDLSLVSPFQFEQVANTFRMNMALGASSDMAMGLTKAIMDTGAALGLSNEMLYRLQYNLAQAIVAGDLTMVNLRQLKLVGLDLAQIFELQLGKSLQEVRDGLKDGSITMEETAQAFMDYTEKYYGGAAERMTKTYQGLRNNIKDLFYFMGADLLSPALDKVAEAGSRVFDALRDLLESGVLKKIGEQFGTMVGYILEGDFESFFGAFGLAEPASEFLANLVSLFTDLASLIMGSVRNGFSWLTDEALPRLEGVLTFVNENWDAFRAGIIGVGAALAAAGILGIIVGIINAINPLVLAIGAIGAVVSILYSAWTNNWLGIQDTVKNVIDTVKGVFEGLWPAISGDAESVWQWLSTTFMEVWPKITEGAQEALSTVQGIFEGIWSAVQPAVEVIGGFLEDIFAAFKEGGFAGAAEELKNLWPAITVVFQEGIGALFESIGDTITTWMPRLIMGFKLLGLKLIGALGEALGVDLGPIQAVFGSIMSSVLTLWNQLQPVFQKVGEVLGMVFNVLKEAIMQIWPSVQKFFSELISHFSSFEPVIEKFKKLWVELSPMLSALLGVIGGVIAALVTFIVGAFSGIAEAIGPFIDGLANVIGYLVDVITGVVSVLRGLFEAIVLLFQGRSDEAGEVLKALGGKIIGIFQNLWGAVKAIFEGLWNTAVALVKGFVEGVLGFIEFLRDQLVGHSLIPEMIDAVVNFFATLPGRVLAFVSELVTTVVTKALELYSAFTGKVQEIIDEVVAIFKGLPAAIVAAWDTIKNGLLRIGKRIVEGIKQGIKDVWDNFINWILGQIGNIIDSIKEFFGIDSPAKAFIPIGKAMLEGIKVGWQSETDALLDALNDTLDKVMEIGRRIGEAFVRAAYTDAFQPKGGQMKEFRSNLAEIASTFMTAAKAFGQRISTGLDLRIDEAEKALALAYEVGAPTAEILRLEKEREKLLAKREKHEEKLLELQQQQADLSFLQQQIKLLDLISTYKLDAAGILQGLTLGIDASAEELMQAMSRALTEIINATASTLQVGSPSKVFERFGRDVMEGFALGISRGSPRVPVPLVGPGFGAFAPAVAGDMRQFSFGPITIETSAPIDELLRQYRIAEVLYG
jgi:tape measure domain-containing protein